MKGANLRVTPLDGRWWRTAARIADVVARSPDFSTILASFRIELQREVRFDRVALLTVENGELAVAALDGDGDGDAERQLPQPARITVDENTVERMRRATTQHIAGERDVPLCTQLGGRASVIVPLLSGGDFVGVIAITRQDATRFLPREVALFEMVAPHLAHAVSNVRARLMRERWTQLLVHDLKSPISVLALNLDLLAQPGLGSDDTAETLQDCRMSVKQLVGMTKDLLDMFRCEEAGTDLHRCRVDLATLIEQVTAPIRSYARGTSLVSEVGPGIELFVDRDLIGRVLDNIVSNAVRYTPTGGVIRIDARLHDGAVTIGIENDGNPISPGVASTLFDRYCQGRDRRTRSRGLGLYLCRLFVEAHQGTIALAARPRTTRFEISLPLPG